MTIHHEPTQPDGFEAYLDGLLEGEDLERFEARLAASPELREQVELPRRIDASLGRLFSGASRDSAPLLLESGSVSRGRAQRRRTIHPALLGLAAAVAIVTAGVWAFAWLALQETRNRLGPVYHETVAAGFVPEEVCTTPEEFAAWLEENYGQALQPADDPSIEYVGWSYAHVVSGYSGVLLARVDGEKVIVVVDRREHDRARQLRPEDPGLTSHRRRIGDLVLYEVTPQGRPRILPVLSR